MTCLIIEKSKKVMLSTITDIEKKTFYKQTVKHTIASSKPPPRARPSIAATDGFLAPDEHNSREMVKDLSNYGSQILSHEVGGRKDSKNYLLKCR